MDSWEVGGKQYARKAIMAWLAEFPYCSLRLLSEGVVLPEWLLLPILKELEKQDLIHRLPGKETARWSI